MRITTGENAQYIQMNLPCPSNEPTKLER